MEKLYHCLWKSSLFGQKLKDEEGNEVEVIDPGIHNNTSGPDFFNSKIKYGDTEWVGNIEIHVKASDWFRHNHHEDPAYDSVILHVVGVSDAEIRRTDGSLIPQVVLTFPESFFSTLSMLSEEMDKVRCANAIPQIPRLNVVDWLETLSVERLQEKASRILKILEQNSSDWQQTCFITLARALGFGLNSEPFELLGRSVSLNFLSRHSDNLFQIEAILFGQASMLDSSTHIFDEYYQALCAEYYFLACKYGMRPMRPGLWKYSKTRPGNFPHRRIALLANLCEGGFSLFSQILEARCDEEILREILRRQLTGYWARHFSFGSEESHSPVALSESSVTLLIINLVVPIIYAHASVCGDCEQGEKAISLLASLPAENNGIIRQWKEAGINPTDASLSQALIHLKKNYCDLRKCLYCRFGNHILRKSL